MKLDERMHDRYVQKRRADILRDHVAELISRDASALDVGRRDGLLAYRLREVRPRSKVARRAGRGLAAHTAIDKLTEWCYVRRVPLRKVAGGQALDFGVLPRLSARQAF